MVFGFCVRFRKRQSQVAVQKHDRPIVALDQARSGFLDLFWISKARQVEANTHQSSLCRQIDRPEILGAAGLCPLNILLHTMYSMNRILNWRESGGAHDESCFEAFILKLLF